MKNIYIGIGSHVVEEIPKDCVLKIKKEGDWININPKDFDICEQGPEHPEYYNAWNNILNNVKNKKNQNLHQREDGCVEIWDEDEDPNQEYDNWGDEIFPSDEYYNSDDDEVYELDNWGDEIIPSEK